MRAGSSTSYRYVVLVFVAGRAHREGQHEFLRGADDLAEVRDFPAQSLSKLHTQYVCVSKTARPYRATWVARTNLGRRVEHKPAICLLGKEIVTGEYVMTVRAELQRARALVGECMY